MVPTRKGIGVVATGTTTWGIRLVLWVLGFAALAHFPALSSTSKSLSRSNRSSRAKDKSDSDPANYPPVSVIIPARNEARSLPKLLDSLKAQSLTPHEIIVIDDASSDDTGSLARGYGAKVLPSRLPATGWTGKSHACWIGAEAASGDLLCFLDADVTLGERGLERLVAMHLARGGLVSILPRHVAVRPYEALSALFNVVSAMGTGAFRLFGRPGRTKIASGPAMICSATDYEALGGHRRIASEIVDDVALGNSFTQAGMPVWCFTGGDDITYRMYPAGLGQLIEGWSKNFATGAAWIAIPQFALVAAWVTGALTAVLLIASALTELALGASPTLAGLTGPGLYYLAYTAQIRHFEKKLGAFPRSAAALFPIGIVFLTAVFACSVLSTFIVHRVIWKGRTIRV